MSLWASPLELLYHEAVQSRDEGCVIPHEVTTAIRALVPGTDEWHPMADQLLEQLGRLTPDATLLEREPNALQDIRRLRPAGPRHLRWKPTERELLDRLHGAWLGRASGCALGKPVEGVGMSSAGGRLVGATAIETYLRNRGDYPLKDYFSGRDVGDGVALWSPESQREHIAYMPGDDDIHYSLIGLGVIEKHGPSFTWRNVADYWSGHLPFTAICTAEAQALFSVWSRTARFGSQGGGGFDSIARVGPLSTADAAYTQRHRNPYREWIGAQIRSDGWAWCCAGMPELAAEFAWRDAHWTHTRNGIYGAMFCAAVQAAAFCVHDPDELVSIGLSEIPQHCRLAIIIRQTQNIVRATTSWRAALEQILAACAVISPSHGSPHQSVAGMHPVHVINNAAICVLSLYYGRMDTVDALTIGVMCGLDTDCNGATIGSIVGAASGRQAFRMDLAHRLNDTICPDMLGFQKVTMTELAQRTAAAWHTVQAYARTRSDVVEAQAG